MLSSQQWPGNLRQIVEVVERLVARVPPGGIIDSATVQDELAEASTQASVRLLASSWAKVAATA